MAVDPEKAIEKLSEYRAGSKKNKNLDHASDDDGEKQEYQESPIRRFFIEMYKFNTILAASLGFAILFSGWITYRVAILWVPLAAIAFGISLITMKTISRMEISKGRKTTIDDMFIIFLIMAGFFGYVPYIPVEFSTFRIIHLALVVLWFAQIYFVNYRKPDVSFSKGQTGGIIEEIGEKSTTDKIKEFLTKERLIYLVISAVFGVLLSIYPYTQL